jgi:hypothetical protein
MCFNLDVEAACKVKDPFHPSWSTRQQGKEEIRQAMAPRQTAILPAAIKAIDVTLLPRSEREVSANDYARRQQFLAEHVGA